METLKELEDSYNKTKEKFQETHTRDLYSYLQLPDDQVNKKNTVIASMLKKNPFKSLFEQKNDDTIKQVKEQYDDLSGRIDKETLILPTCGELNDNKELITVFRPTSKIVPGGDRSPFKAGTYIVSPRVILRVFKMGGYGVPSDNSLRVSMLNGPNITVGSEINKLIGEFEKNPSEHPGDLVKAYKSIMDEYDRIGKGSEE